MHEVDRHEPLPDPFDEIRGPLRAGHGPKRRCERCGAYLSSANRDRLCYPCQRGTGPLRSLRDPVEPDDTAH
jgi:hypothetical protein